MFYELSYRLKNISGEDDVLNLPGLEIIWRAKFGDGQGKTNQTSSIKIFSHHGTHIDAPSHVYDNALTLDDFKAEDFIFDSPLIIQCLKGDKEKIEVDDLHKYRDDLKKADCLIVYTGFSEYLNSRERFIRNSPGFSPESLQYLIDNFPQIKCLGMDIFSIENIIEGKPKGWPGHKAFLKENEKRIVIENMNLRDILDKKVDRIMAIPLLIENEACPVTVVAEVNERPEGRL